MSLAEGRWVRFDDATEVEIDKLARIEDRPRSTMIRRLVLEALAARGILVVPDEPIDVSSTPAAVRKDG